MMEDDELKMNSKMISTRDEQGKIHIQKYTCKVVVQTQKRAHRMMIRGAEDEEKSDISSSKFLPRQENVSIDKN